MQAKDNSFRGQLWLSGSASGLRSQADSVKVFVQEKEESSQEHLTSFWEEGAIKVSLCMRKAILQSKAGREINTVERKRGLRRKSRIPWNGVCEVLEILRASRGLIRRLLLNGLTPEGDGLTSNPNSLSSALPGSLWESGGHTGTQGWAARAGLSLLLVKRLVDRFDL